MSADRELLELAARAAGPGVWLEHDDRPWNPLTDDGDALRLAVDCRLLDDDDFIAEVRAIWLYPTPNKQAAVRRAIVHAAAGIGSAVA